MRADVWLRSGGELTDDAWWPAEAGPRQAVVLAGGALPVVPGGERMVPVIHDGELLGALSVTKKRGDAFTPTEERLVGNLATQAGLVLRNVGLSEQLMARLAELRASRERLVTAQDRERRRLERDLRDGAQADLAGLAGMLAETARALDHDESRAKMLLNEVTSEIATALASLRELARGIYPPLLADMGVAAALDAQARKAPVPVSVEADGVGRYPQEIEAAVYFCVLEALRSTAGHAGTTSASVRLCARDGELRFEVAGEGGGPRTNGQPSRTGGGRPGADLQAMADRIDALDGEIHIEPAPGPGTRISGSVPATAIGLPALLRLGAGHVADGVAGGQARAGAWPCGRRPPPRRTSGAARRRGRTAPARAAATRPPPGPGRRSCPRTPAVPARAGRGCSCGR